MAANRYNAQLTFTNLLRMDLFTELRRRQLPRTALFYIVSVWVVIQVADIVLPAFNASDLILQALIIVCILGFPIALVLAWLFDLTPQGFQRTPEHDMEVVSVPSPQRSTANLVVIVLLCLALVLMFVDNYVLSRLETFEVVTSSAPSRSLAVLPFTNQSAASENAEFFATGVHDDLLALLSKLNGVRVISRTSVDRYKDSDLTLQQIAESLGTTRILEGGVQQAGDRVRINVQLVDVELDRNIWAETYDRELTVLNVFEIQAEIAEKIAASLEAKLTPAQLTQLATVPTENLDAYRAHLLGKERLESLTTANLESAIEYFERAIALDPEFAAAYIGLADAYLYLIDFGALDEREAIMRATPFVEQALKLEPTSGEAHVTLATIRFYDFDYPGAERAYLQALELKPNYVPAHQWYADLLIRMGQPEQAMELLREGLLLDPLSPGLMNEIVDARAALGQFDEAIAGLTDVLEVEPEHQLSFWRAARINAYGLGRFDEAIRWMQESLAADPNDAFGFAFVGSLYTALGDLATAQDWIDQALELGPNSSFARSAAASLANSNGDTKTVSELSQQIISARGIEAYAGGLAMLRNIDVADGRPKDAVDRYRRHFPEFFTPNQPTVDAANYQAAAGLAVLLHWVGESEHAALLNDRVLELIERFPRTGWAGFGIIDAQLHAAQGRTSDALAALRAAVDAGWRPILDVPLARDPSLESLWEEPAFKAILAEIDADMAAQLKRIRKTHPDIALTR